jgi:hypothetical protein
VDGVEHHHTGIRLDLVTGWSHISGFVRGAPTIVTGSGSRADVFGRMTDGTFRHLQRTASPPRKIKWPL